MFFTLASKELDSYSYIFIYLYIFTNKNTLQVPPKNAAKLETVSETKVIRCNTVSIYTYGKGVGGRLRAVLTGILQNIQEGISVIFCVRLHCPVLRPKASVPFSSGQVIPSTGQVVVFVKKKKIHQMGTCSSLHGYVCVVVFWCVHYACMTYTRTSLHPWQVPT